MAELHSNVENRQHEDWCELRVRPLRPHAPCTCGATPEAERLAEYRVAWEGSTP